MSALSLATKVAPPWTAPPARAASRARAAPALAQRVRGVRARAARVAASGDAASAGDGARPVDDWIARWKTRVASGEPAPEPLRPEDVLRGPDPRTGYRYVFAGGLSADACAFSALILRDALEPRGVRLNATQLTPPDGTPWTLSGALRDFEDAVAALPGDEPLRLIGASTGALVCTLYAERHPDAVDSLFLMSPTFNLGDCLARACGGEEGLRAWRGAGVARLEGVSLEWAAVADVATHAAYPFVRCRAYVAHGNLDAFAELEDSLTWVRHASVNMRRRGMPTDAVPERRLLEVADDHALAASVPSLTTKLLEWHGLWGLEAADLAPRVSADLEARRPQDFAQGHGKNFEVYRDWLIAQGFDPDDMD